jgi:hypothetical protein
VHETLPSSGSESHRKSDPPAQELDRGIKRRDIHQDARAKPVTREGGAVAGQRQLVAGPSGNVAIDLGRQCLSRQILELVNA